MKSLFPPSLYTDSDVFEHERQTLFARVWQVAGFASDLAATDDYVTTEIGGKSVVVQNFDGELKAFANVCSHRFARIRCDAKGNGKLRCSYHGWIYNAEGIPYSIPSRPRFDDLQDRAQVAKLALRAYDVDRCGGLIFVREQAAQEPGMRAPSLREFLADSYPIVETMSLAFGRLADSYEVVVSANWKATVENTLEGYHVGFVHANTLKKLEKAGDDRMDFRFYGVHSAHRAPVDDVTGRQLRKIAAAVGAPFPVEGYVHQLIFPNLTITTTHGTVFGVQQFLPVSPGTTVMRSHLFETQLQSDAKGSGPLLTRLSETAAEFARRVFLEDKEICEKVQLGLRDASRIGVLSDEEERVSHFQRSYVDLSGPGMPGTVAQ